MGKLDIGFTGAEEAKTTRNPYGINMSGRTKYVDNSMCYYQHINNLLG